MSDLKPIKVYGKGGPNPPKVAIVVGELGVPFEIVKIPLSDVKKDYYTKINPNGRLPSVHDPNTDLTLWESGAIIEYLVDKYDKDQKISFAPGSAEAYLAKQWIFFQASGQGPYYEQASWFKKFHPERAPTAVERYVGEINRVSGVLEKSLTEQEKLWPGEDGPWLKGSSGRGVKALSKSALGSGRAEDTAQAPRSAPTVEIGNFMLYVFVWRMLKSLR